MFEASKGLGFIQTAKDENQDQMHHRLYFDLTTVKITMDYRGYQQQYDRK